MTKQKHINAIKRVIEKAREDGIMVVVATDPEGNNWNELNPLYLEYGDTKEGYIALGVWETKDEGDIFKDEVLMCNDCAGLSDEEKEKCEHKNYQIT